MNDNERVIIIPELEEIYISYQARKEWNDEEEAILRRYYGKIPAIKIAGYLGRSIHSVMNKANGMGLRGL